MMIIAAALLALRLSLGWIGGVEWLRNPGGAPFVMVPATATAFLLLILAVYLDVTQRRIGCMLAILAVLFLVFTVSFLQEIGLAKAASFFLTDLKPGEMHSPATAIGFTLFSLIIAAHNGRFISGEFPLLALATLGGSVAAATAVTNGLSDYEQHLPFYNGMSNTTAFFFLWLFGAFCLMIFPPAAQDEDDSQQPLAYRS
jgi:hypothetical protein